METSFGWHLIRLDEVHPRPTYEEEKSFYEKRVREGSRSSIVNSAVNQTIKNQFGFEKGDGNAEFSWILFQMTFDEIMGL